MTQFHKFFIECSLYEADAELKRLYFRLALNSGCGLIFKRGPQYYLSLENNSEFKIPAKYDRVEHEKLSACFGRGARVLNKF